MLDGTARIELSLAADVVVLDALARQGVEVRSASRALVGRDGMPVAAGLRAADLREGTVLTLVDLGASAPRMSDAAGGRKRLDGSLAAWWGLGVIGVLVAVLALGVPDAMPLVARSILGAATGVAAVGAATAWAVRTRTTPGSSHPGLAPFAACLALAVAAGVAVVPPMPGGTTLAVCAGLCCAAVLGALVAVVARSVVLRAQAGTVTVILLGLVLVWAIALLLALPVAAPAAIALGAAPVALRALPSSLLDVPPGMFLEFRRFQTSRWAVRETTPAEAGPLDATSAADLVARSSGRLLAGTALLALVAAVSAPFALPSFDGADPVVLGGRIGLAATAVLALLLGARRSPSAPIRWMPRAAAVAVMAATLAALLPLAPSLVLLVVAGGLLALGAVVGFAVVPAARGSRSLFWSRMGDRVEGLAVALCLPAGLVAAGVIDLVRAGMAP